MSSNFSEASVDKNKKLIAGIYIQLPIKYLIWVYENVLTFFVSLHVRFYFCHFFLFPYISNNNFRILNACDEILLISADYVFSEKKTERIFLFGSIWTLSRKIPQPKSSNNQYEDQLFNAGQFTKVFFLNLCIITQREKKVFFFFSMPFYLVVQQSNKAVLLEKPHIRTGK